MPENQPKTIRLYELVNGGGRCRAGAAEAGDSLFDWINRGFDLYGGIWRDPRLRALAA
jgi:hypothetical protein